jgi:cytochrome b involved in lipid metabolism
VTSTHAAASACGLSAFETRGRLARRPTRAPFARGRCRAMPRAAHRPPKPPRRDAEPRLTTPIPPPQATLIGSTRNLARKRRSNRETMPAVSRKHTKAPSAAPLVGGAKSTSRGAAPTAACYTPAQVAEHDALDDTWVSVDGAVYDLTHWIARHPGGSIPLRQYAGRDMTDAFRAYHGPDGKAAKTLRSYYVGELVMSAEDADAAETSSSEGSAMSADEQPHVFAFRELAKGLETDFHTDYWHYLKLFVSLTTLFASAVYCVIGEGTPRRRTCWARFCSAFSGSRRCLSATTPATARSRTITRKISSSAWWSAICATASA